MRVSVVVRRRGRERLNYLNAVPIREIYERWMGPFSEFWSTSLLGAKCFVEQQAQALRAGEFAMKEFKNGEGLDRYDIAQEVVINASVDSVWTALTTDIGKWWGFRLVDGEVSLDAKIGGQFLEKAADGSGALWGIVTQVKQGSLLRLEGQLGMTDMPVKSHYTYELEGKGDTTLLKLTHYCFGMLSPDSGKHHSEGWQLLLGKHLKDYLEAGETTRIKK